MAGPVKPSGRGPASHAMTDQTGTVAVVGSLNMDSIYRVATIPRPGETVPSEPVRYSHGGKGNNQATASARAGGVTHMIGMVGSDAAGAALRDGLLDEHVGVEHLAASEAQGTGTAIIILDEQAENSIIVDGGANRLVSADHVNRALRQLEPAVTLVSLEIPRAAALMAAEASPGITILNPAPASPFEADELQAFDILTPNQTELAILCGATPPTSAEETVALIRDHLPSHDGLVTIVTLGAEGVLLVDGERAEMFRAPQVDAVDTTGAGDCFNGTLAARLAVGDELADAIRFAVAAASLSVTRVGAASAMPTADEVAAFLTS